MADETTTNNGLGMGMGILIGLVILMVILAVFYFLGRPDTTPAPTSPAAPEGATQVENSIELPDVPEEVDVNVNQE